MRLSGFPKVDANGVGSVTHQGPGGRVFGGGAEVQVAGRSVLTERALGPWGGVVAAFCSLWFMLGQLDTLQHIIKQSVVDFTCTTFSGSAQGEGYF